MISNYNSLTGNQIRLKRLNSEKLQCCNCYPPASMIPASLSQLVSDCGRVNMLHHHTVSRTPTVVSPIYKIQKLTPHL